MADGSVKFDTAIDESGFRTGLADLGKLLIGSKIVSELAQLGKAAIQAGIDFESAFAGVKKTVNETVNTSFADLRKAILDMSKEIPLAATEIAGIAEAAGQLGIQTDSILEFTRVMADLGVATNMTSDQAATALARLANITQMSQDNFDELGATVVALGNNFATTESEIVEMALRLAGTGKQVGLTEDQILSLSAAASSVGLAAELGGSAFSRVLSMMQLSAEQGGEALSAFARVAGMTASEFKTAFEQDAAGAFTAFIEGLGKAEESGKSAIGVIAEMGEISELSALDTVAVRDALLRASGASNVFKDALVVGSEAWAENIALTNEAEQRYQTMESRLQLFKNTASSLGIALYEGIKGPLGEVVSYATEAMNQLEAAFTEGGVAGMARAGASIIYNLISGIVANVPTLMQSAGDALLSFADGFATYYPIVVQKGAELLTQLGTGIAQNLPSLVSKALDALMKFATTLYDNFPTIIQAGFEFLRSLIQGIVKSIPELLSKGPEIVSKFANIINDNFPTILAKGVQLIWELIKGLISCIPDLIANAGKILTAIVDVFTAYNWLNLGKNIITWFKNGITNMITAVKTAATNVNTNIVSTISQLPSKLLELGKNAITFLGNGIKGMASSAVNAAKNVLTSVISGLSGFPAKFVQIGKNLLLGMADGIAAAVGSVISRAISAVSGIVSSVKNFFGIKSPSRLFKNLIGKNLMLGLAEGIEDETSTAVASMGKAAKAIADTDFTVGNVEFDDPDALYAKVNGTVNAKKAETTSAKSAEANSYDNTVGDNTTPTDSTPQYIQNDIYIDGRKTARILTPYVAKEIAWEGK